MDSGRRGRPKKKAVIGNFTIRYNMDNPEVDWAAVRCRPTFTPVIKRIEWHHKRYEQNGDYLFVLAYTKVS